VKTVFDTRGASAHQLRLLADWVREQVLSASAGEFDAIRFVEIDLQKIFPNLGIFIEPDDAMGGSRAFVSDDPLGIVMSESIYNGASNGDLFSTEIVLHEVGHLFLHKKYSSLHLNSSQNPVSRVKSTPLANDAEWQANIFAMCLLYDYKKNRAITNTSDIKAKYRASERQAHRIAQHFSRLRSREGSIDILRDRRWLAAVLSGLPAPTKQASKAPIGEQLSMFFQSENKMSLAACA
jgi:hypothetical protein